MSSPYPRDDFDAVTPPRDGRRGAHRAAPRRSTRVLAPLVVAAVVAVAGGVGYLALSPTSSTTASASTAQDDAAVAAAAAADDSADDATGAAAGDGASAGASAAATQAVDQAVPVVVLNGTGTKGLAATTQAELEESGWTVSSTGNATTAQRSAHEGTTVLYPSADLEATATALSLALRGSAALDPAAPAGTLTVVLLP